MQHGSLRAPVRVFMAAVLLCLSFLAAPKAAAAQLQNVNGITLLSFDSQQIVSIGNQTSGRCSWYALRYARTILDGKPCSGSSPTADPENLRESDFYALDPARVSVNGTLAVTKLLDGTIWTDNSPLKVAA